MKAPWTHGPSTPRSEDPIAARVHAKHIRNTSPEDVWSPVLFALAAIVVPLDLTTATRLGVAGTIIATFPVGVLINRVVSDRYASTVATVIHVIVVVSLAAFVPELWAGSLVFTAAASTSLLWQKRQTDGVFLGLFGALALGIVGWYQGRDTWIAASASLGLVAVSVWQWASERHQQRAETDEQFDDLVDTAKLLFWQVEPNGERLSSIIGNSVDILGYTPDQLAASEWIDLIAPEDRHLLASIPLSRTGDFSDRADMTIRLTHRDGHAVTMRHLIRRDAKGNLLGAAADISELARANDALRVQAHRDALTGLANRRLLTEKLEAAFVVLDQEQQRPLTDYPDTGIADTPLGSPMVALLLFDLNDFKSVNDALGHTTGDQVLRVLADRMRGAFGDAEVCARVGGDEFAVLLTGDLSRASAVQAAERLAGVLRDPIQLAGLRLPVKSSIGVALAPDHAQTPEELMQRADIALYQAKGSSETVCVYEFTPHEISPERLQLSVELHDALERGEFELWFQPKVDLRSGELFGFEGLARWRHPERGVLLPDQFLPILGVSVAHSQFTDHMLAQGIEFVGSCHRADRFLTMALNISTVSFLDTSLPDRIARLLELHQVGPQYLFLEVTEHELLLDRDSTSEVLLALANLGVQLSIDDFGTGHSSLSRLRSLQIHEMKIDRSFVSGLGVDEQDLTIVRTIIDLARSLDKRTVAEGVETQQQVQILQGLECDLAQGFLFDPALPPRECLDKLAGNDLNYRGLLDTVEAADWDR